MEKRKLIFILLMMIITLLTACGPGERKSAKGDKANSIDVSLFPTAVTNNAKAVEGGKS